MNAPLLTAVIYNEKTALRFLKERPKVDRLLPLTPNAQAVLADVNLPVLSTLDLYTDYGHRRVIARARRMERKFWFALEKETQLSQAALESLWGMLHPMMTATLRLWYTLRSAGGILLILEKKEWKQYDSLEETHASLFSYLASQSPFQKPFWRLPYLTGLVRRINIIICQIAGRKSVLMLTGKSHGFENLILNAKQLFPEIKIMTIRGSSGKLKDLLISLINLVKVVINNDRLVTVTVVPTPSRVAEQCVEDLLSLIDDPVLQNGVDAYNDFLLQNVTLTDGLKSGTKQLWQLLRPKMLIAHTLRWWEDAVMGEIAKESNTPSILISHGSHSKSDFAEVLFSVP